MAENALVRLRKQAGYKSGYTFAETKTNIQPKTYQRYEAGITPLPLQKAWELADVFGCTIDEVVGRTSLDDSKQGSMQLRYEALGAEERQHIDEYMEYMEYRTMEKQRARKTQIKVRYLSMVYSFANSLLSEDVDEIKFTNMTVTELKDKFLQYLNAETKRSIEREVERMRLSPSSAEFNDLKGALDRYRKNRMRQEENEQAKYLQAFDDTFGTTPETMNEALSILCNPAEYEYTITDLATEEAKQD